MMNKIQQYIINFILDKLGIADAYNALIDKYMELQQRLLRVEERLLRDESDFTAKNERDNGGIRANFWMIRDDIVRIDDTLTQMDNQLSALSRQMKNPLGAGRKKRGTAEEIQKIIAYRKAGNSFGTIAKMMSEATGEHWSKSTVSNIINRADN